MSDEAQALADAIASRNAEYRAALSALRDNDTTMDDAAEAVRLLRGATALVAVLSRLTAVLDVADLHRAFGSPGDYGSPIGDALAALYWRGQ